MQFLGKDTGESSEVRQKLIKEYINSEYYKKVREILPKLEVLDQFDREGHEFESDEDESDPGDEQEDTDEEADEDDEGGPEDEDEDAPE